MFISVARLVLFAKEVVVDACLWGENEIRDWLGMSAELPYGSEEELSPNGGSAFLRAGASTIALADLHGVSDNLVTKLKLTATQAGRAEPTVMSCTVDISEEDSVQAMYKIVSERFDGRLDIVISNAANMEPYKPLLDSDLDVYWRTWEVNIHGILKITRAFLPMQLLTRKSNNGLCTMVNVSSSGALSARPGSAKFLTYCVNPGAIKTKITETAPEEVRNRFPDRPEIAGDTITWLAAERKEWLAGRYVSCPWDKEELMKKKDEIIEKDLLKMRMAF
ncbi:uncharacterized protein EAF01_010377 [Botrytis porri]|uniref:uncharacterized protein n=1 Tax=Botrytis porri TaxID=87229 RepID=UPI0018FFC477|nr:uncharacterized protein EAF01_010377 [Botrytis porri]KAF7892297.1 hypothetical protein EAF01_010377 [Botrytis porri]